MPPPHDSTTDRRLIGAEWIGGQGDEVTLSITQCHSCAGRWFPPRAQCSRCASTDVATTASASTGEVYASTLVRIGPARFRPPYVLSYVDMSGVRVLAHTRSGHPLAPGTPVRLAVDEIGADDDSALSSYVVTPIYTGGGAR